MFMLCIGGIGWGIRYFGALIANHVSTSFLFSFICLYISLTRSKGLAAAGPAIVVVPITHKIIFLVRGTS